MLIFDVENLVFLSHIKLGKSDFGPFRQFVINTRISFEDVDFLAKIYLILYPFLENSITLITIWGWM